MKKIAKKLLVVTLAATMIMGLGLTAFAAGKNDSGWGDYRYWSTWGNWNESDDTASVPLTLTSDPSSYYMKERSTENHEMAPGYYMEKSFFPTTIPGVYAVSSVPVAIRTPAHELLNKYGVGEGSSILARFYDLPERSVNAKNELDACAAELGAEVVGYFDGSLAKIDSNEKLSELNSDSTYELFIGIGTNDATKQLAAIRVKDGGVVDVLPDAHPDTNILSIETTPDVASYAVVVLDAGTDLTAVAAPEAPAEGEVVAPKAADITEKDIEEALGVAGTGNPDVDAVIAAFIPTLNDAQLAQLVAIGTAAGEPDEAALAAFVETLNEEQLLMLLAIGLGAA